MKGRFLLGLAVLLFCDGLATAQDKVEITGDYSYYRFNPGLPSPWKSQNLNGGGQATYYLTSWLGFAADLQGYGSYTQCLKSNSRPV